MSKRVLRPAVVLDPSLRADQETIGVKRFVRVLAHNDRRDAVVVEGCDQRIEFVPEGGVEE